MRDEDDETPPPPRYAGLATFFRAPWTEDFETAGLDVALAGVPFDGGATNRPGARHGPRAVRDQSSLIRRHNQGTGAAPFAGGRVADVGDAPTARAFSLEAARENIQAFFARLAASGARPLACGGDHSITLPILRGLAPERPLGLIHIDAHCDTAGPCAGLADHEAAAIRRAVEEGLIDPRRSAQIAVRGTLLRPDLWRFSAEKGMRVMQIEEIEAYGWRACMEEALAIVGDDPIYVSVDMDALDPAFAPGVGAPEAGGLTMREAMGMIRMLSVCDIRGADLVEVSAPFDPAGLTALNGATLMFELLCAMTLRRRG